MPDPIVSPLLEENPEDNPKPKPPGRGRPERVKAPEKDKSRDKKVPNFTKPRQQWGADTPDYTQEYRPFLNEMKKLSAADYKADRDSIIAASGGNPHVSSYDLFLLKSYIKYNSITHVLELGCGTTSHFLDSLGVIRKSFALSEWREDPDTRIEFEKIDLYETDQPVRDYLDANPAIDFILVDCDHTAEMAEVVMGILEHANWTKPVFIHDWMGVGESGYREQEYYLRNGILDHYDIHYMSSVQKGHWASELGFTERNFREKFLVRERVKPRSVILVPK